MVPFFIFASQKRGAQQFISRNGKSMPKYYPATNSIFLRICLLLLILNLIISCGGEHHSSSDQQPPSVSINRIAAPELPTFNANASSSTHDYSATLLVNGNTFDLQFDQASQSFSTTLSNIPKGQNTFEILIYQDSEIYGKIAIISAKKQIDIGPGKNELAFERNDFNHLNDDSDEFTNHDELLQNTNPFRADENMLEQNTAIILAIKSQLDISEDESVPHTRLKEIRTLDLSLLTIKARLPNLYGLRYLYNLEELNLNEQWQINDISEIQYLTKLRVLNLNNTTVKTLEHLENLVQLEELTLSRFMRLSNEDNLLFNLAPTPDIFGPLISDLTPIKNLLNLRTLDITNQNVNSISPIQSLLNLKSIRMCGNNITDIQPLVNLEKLEHVDLGEYLFSPLTTEEAINYYSNLDLGFMTWFANWQSKFNLAFNPADVDNWLDLYCRNPVVNISFLSQIPHLQHLSIAASDLTHFDLAETFENLTYLDISYNAIESLDFIETAFPNLRFLEASGLNLSGVTRIPGSALTHLNLGYSQISALPEIVASDSLIHLNLIANQLTQIPDLSLFPKIEELNIASNETATLTASQPQANLTKILANDTNLSSLPPAEHLPNLHHLELTRANFTNTEDFSDLTQLIYLNLSENNVKDLNFINGLVNLEELYIQSNQINETPQTIHLPQLKHLDLHNNGIENPPLIFAPELLSLQVTQNPLTNFLNLSGTPSLEELIHSCSRELRDSPLKTNVHLSTFPATLDHLELTSCNLDDLSSLSHLKSLTLLSVSFNNISSKEHFPALSSLRWLGASYNQLSGDIDLSSNFPSLETVYMEGNNIESIEFSQPEGLQTLSLDDNNITDLQFLEPLSELTALHLSHNKIEDLSSLSQLSRLSDLKLHKNLVENIEPLQHLLDLRILNIDNNKITRFPLNFGKSTLIQLDISNNPISEEIRIEGYEVLELITASSLPSPALTLRNNIKLEEAKLTTHNFEVIRLENLPNLKSLFSDWLNSQSSTVGSKLIELRLSNTPNLKQLRVQGHPLLEDILNTNDSIPTELDIIHSGLDSSVLNNMNSIQHLLIEPNDVISAEHINQHPALNELTVYLGRNKNLSTLNDVTNIEKITLTEGKFTGIDCDLVDSLKTQLPNITIVDERGECSQ